VSDNTPSEQVERAAYTTGLWFEGIASGAVLALPTALLFALVVGLTMGVVRLGVRGMESRFHIGGNQ
tara:strand:- start:236 stop:436 length:201 start_codon:yes stop_codon:yes gene_type:complete